MTQGTITIRKERDKPIRNQHPWIFSGAIANAESATPGEIVSVQDHNGNFLARGYWNPKSQIQVRVLTWQDEAIDDTWWRRMLERTIVARMSHNQRQKTQVEPYGYRLINAENDFLPGLIVDRYGNVLVLQALTLYIDQHKHALAERLVDVLYALDMPVESIYERSDVDARKREGLDEATGVLWGEEPPQFIYMRDTQGQLVRTVDIMQGHKTGYYLDQLGNQDRILDFVTQQQITGPDASVLNLFSYTGGFGLALPCHVINVDSSRYFLELAEQNYALVDRVASAEFVQADAFDYLHDAVKDGAQHDLVILDPPKFAHNKRQIDRASRGYKDLNLNAFKLIKPGGYLLTFSCSGAVSADLFQKIVFGALADSGRQAQIVQHLGPGDDHPVALSFPEGAYLKGLLLRVY
jgi:23S rRNA (cytosine1962-C5)-methyltransferase